MKSFNSVFFLVLLFNNIYPHNNTCGLGAIKYVKPNTVNIKDNELNRIENGVFIVRNLDTRLPEEIDFDLIIENSAVKFYAQKTEIENGNIDVSIIEDIFNEFTSTTFQINNTVYDGGILGAEKSLLGNLPEFNHSDNSVYVLFVDIKDPYNQPNEFVSGFFDPADQEMCTFVGIFEKEDCIYPYEWKSDIRFNSRNVLYIDTNPLFINAENYQSKLFVIAHELQHLLHWNSDKKEGYFFNENKNEYFFHNPWLNEGLSDLIASLLGYGERDYNPYLKDVTIGLDEWGSTTTLPYYAKSALFMKFIYGQYGINTINDIFHHEKEGIESIGEIVDLDYVFEEWIKSLSIGLMGETEIAEYDNIYELDTFFSMGKDDYLFSRTIEISPYSIYPLGLPEFTYFDSIMINGDYTLIQSINNSFSEDFGELNRVIYFALEDSLKNIESTFNYSTIASPNNRHVFIYPNPVTSSEVSYLRFFGNESMSSVNIKIVSLLGEIVSENIYQLDVNHNLVIRFNPNIPTGVYMVTAKTKSTQENIKITVLK